MELIASLVAELPGRMVSVAEPEAAGCPIMEFPDIARPDNVDAWLTAVIVAVVAAVTEGAVKKPVLDMLPTLVCHVTPV